MIVALRSAVLAMLVATGASAQTLTIGLAVETSTIDPQFRNTAENYTVARHIFEPLIDQDTQQRLRPGLALSWQPVDATSWAVRLRAGVRFHDGRPFDADDAAFSLLRSARIVGSPGSYAAYSGGIAGITVSDPLTLLIHTSKPDPLLPTELSVIATVSRNAPADTGAFDSGAAVIGTGPYKFVAFRHGQSVRLRANADYWGGPPPWTEVELRPIPDAAARVAALLAGDVDAIDAVPPGSVADLRWKPGFRLVSIVSNRLIFLMTDTVRPRAPTLTDAAGQPLAANPLRDPRVRRAISLAINRNILVDNVMQGMAVAAGQFLPDGFYGVSQGLRPDRFDAAESKRLLAETGYPGGFGLTLTAPNNRYVNDGQLGEAIAGMLTRAGIRTRLDSEPSSQVLAGLRRGEVALLLWGWSSETGEPSGPLRFLVATPDPARGLGAANRLGYSNARFDAALSEALAASGAEREPLLRQATELVIGDAGLIPLLFQRLAWAMRRPLTLAPNPVGNTYAWQFSADAAAP